MRDQERTRLAICGLVAATGVFLWVLTPDPASSSDFSRYSALLVKREALARRRAEISSAIQDVKRDMDELSAKLKAKADKLAALERGLSEVELALKEVDQSL